MAQFLLKMAVKQRNMCDSSLPNTHCILYRWWIRLWLIAIKFPTAEGFFNVLMSKNV